MKNKHFALFNLFILFWEYKLAESFWKHKLAESANLCFQSGLEVHLQPELELSGIKGGSRAAVVAAAAVTLTESIDIGEERRCRSFVEAIEEVEPFGDQVYAHALAKAHGARQAHVERGVTVRNAAVAP